MPHPHLPATLSDHTDARTDASKEARTDSSSLIAQPQRRLWCAAAAGWLVAGCAPLARQGEASPPVSPTATLPSGSRGPLPFTGGGDVGGLPAGWHPHIMRRDLPPTHYELTRKDGRMVVQADAARSVSGLRCDVNIDPKQTPWLNFSWRVDQIDPRATVADDDLDDAPARVVITFDGPPPKLTLRETIFHEQVELFTGHVLPHATLMYVWDGQGPLEAIFQYPRSSRIRYLVVDSGAAHLGEWRQHRRNVALDYQRVFGEPPPGRIRHVGVLTDSDDLRIQSRAWFGDLSFSA